MLCLKCGATVPDGSPACPRCTTPVFVAAAKGGNGSGQGHKELPWTAAQSSPLPSSTVTERYTSPARAGVDDLVESADSLIQGLTAAMGAVLLRPPPFLRGSLPRFVRLLRYFWPHVRQEHRLLAGSLLALFADIGLRLLEPWPLKLVFDRVLPGGRARGFSGIPAVDALDSATLLTISALGVVAIIGLRSMATYCNTVGFALIGNRVLSQVRNELYSHLQCLSLSFHDKTSSGDLIVRVISDIGLLKDVAVTSLLPLLANVLVLVSMVGLMLWLQRDLALLALAMIPLYWIATTRLSGRIREVARKQRKREGAMANTAAQSIGAIKVVQALSLEGMFARAFSGENDRSLKQDVKGKRLEARLERTVDVLIAINTALVLWYGAQLVLRRALTPGDLLVFLTYLKNAFKPMRDLAKYTGRIAKATAAGDRVLNLMDQTPEVRDLPGAVPAPPFGGAVHFERVSFAYEPGHPVLEEVDFAVQPGQIVALVAPSGTGKSTLASLILRLYDPAQGRVKIDGRDIREYTLLSLRSQISVVLQDSVLFAASVQDNIAYGAPNATAEEIEAAAHLANAHEFIAAMRQGYDTVMGERGVTVSHGQRQRIAIARAAIRKAPILILDEPTTGLDEANQRIVVEALDRLARDRTTFLVTHDMLLASGADLNIYLERGRSLERGTHEELMRANGRYAALSWLRTAVPDDLIPEESDAVSI